MNRNILIVGVIILIAVAFIFGIGNPLSSVTYENIETFEDSTQDDIDNMFETPWDSTATLDTTGKINGMNSVHVTNRIQKTYVTTDPHFELKIRLNTAKRTDIVLRDQDFPNGKSIYVCFGEKYNSVFPDKNIYTYDTSGSIYNIWGGYTTGTVYHIEFDLDYDNHVCYIRIDDGQYIVEATIPASNFQGISRYSIGENNADIYVDDISYIMSDTSSGIANIMDEGYNMLPSEIEMGQGTHMLYNVNNHGENDLLWGRIINTDTDEVISGTYWEEEISPYSIKTFEVYRWNPYPVTDFRIEAGHFNGEDKVIDDTLLFSVSYIDNIPDNPDDNDDDDTSDQSVNAIPGFEFLTLLLSLVVLLVILKYKKGR